jgi:hypothetical protein
MNVAILVMFLFMMNSLVIGAILKLRERISKFRNHNVPPSYLAMINAGKC